MNSFEHELPAVVCTPVDTVLEIGGECENTVQVLSTAQECVMEGTLRLDLVTLSDGTNAALVIGFTDARGRTIEFLVHRGAIIASPK